MEVDEVLEEEDGKNIDEEVVLMKAKNAGFRRTAPQDVPNRATKEPITHKCMLCLFEFASNGILEAHMKTHKKQTDCDVCSECFDSKENLKEHKENEHRIQNCKDEWNCQDCSFQANCAAELMKHLKIVGHQPSKSVGDKRKVFEDYKQCYTCKLDFDGFYNLMVHRNNVHPSNKKCRNYAAGTCPFSSDCWYVHGEEAEERSDTFKCEICANEFKGRDNFMNHKKLIHPEFVQTCDRFSANKCPRPDSCWFEHKVIQKKSNEDNIWPKLASRSPPKSGTSVFREATTQMVPPDQISTILLMVNKLCNKVENMEKRFSDLMN